MFINNRVSTVQHDPGPWKAELIQLGDILTSNIQKEFKPSRVYIARNHYKVGSTHGAIVLYTYLDVRSAMDDIPETAHIYIYEDENFDNIVAEGVYAADDLISIGGVKNAIVYTLYKDRLPDEFTDILNI